MIFHVLWCLWFLGVKILKRTANSTPRSIKPLTTQFAPSEMLKHLVFHLCAMGTWTQSPPSPSKWVSSFQPEWCVGYYFPSCFIPELIQQTFQLFLATAGNTNLPAPIPKGVAQLQDSLPPCSYACVMPKSFSTYGRHQISQSLTSHLNTAGQCTATRVTYLVKLEQWLCPAAKPLKSSGTWTAECAQGKASNPSCLLLYLLPVLISEDSCNLPSS